MPSRTRSTMTPEEEARWEEELSRRPSPRGEPRHDWRELITRYTRRYAIDETIPFGMLYRVERRYGLSSGTIRKYDLPYRKVNALEWGNLVARCVRNRVST